MLNFGCTERMTHLFSVGLNSSLDSSNTEYTDVVQILVVFGLPPSLPSSVNPNFMYCM